MARSCEALRLTAARGPDRPALPAAVRGGPAPGWRRVVAVLKAFVPLRVPASLVPALPPDAGAHQPWLGALSLHRTTFVLLPVRTSEVEERSAHRLQCVAGRLANPSPTSRFHRRLLQW